MKLPCGHPFECAPRGVAPGGINEWIGECGWCLAIAAYDQAKASLAEAVAKRGDAERERDKALRTSEQKVFRGKCFECQSEIIYGIPCPVCAEQARWQKAIEVIDVVKDQDGSGCDSGDPLDLTVGEISMAIHQLEDRIEELQSQAKMAAAEPRSADHGRAIDAQPWEPTIPEALRSLYFVDPTVNATLRAYLRRDESLVAGLCRTVVALARVKDALLHQMCEMKTNEVMPFKLPQA